MQFSIVAGTVLAALSSCMTVAAAGPGDPCHGAYYVDLIPAPENCTQFTKKNDTVTLDYKGYFPNGTVFDQSYNSSDGPLVYQYGVGQVIKGFDQGLNHACVGEKRWVMIPPEFGYGNRSVGGGLIPPNSTLIFEILLEKIERNKTAKSSLVGTPPLTPF